MPTAQAGQPADTDQLDTRLASRTSQDFAQEERDGLALAAKVRLAILGAVMVWLAIDLPMSGIAYAYELSVVAVYLVLGIAHLIVARRAIGLPYSVYALFGLDIALMGLMYSHTNPFIEFPEFSPSLLLLIPNFKWFFIILMQAAFALTPRLVIWCGACILSVRLAQFGYIWSQGEFYTEAALVDGDWTSWIRAWYDPQFISVLTRISEIIFILGMTLGLAAIVLRSRDLVLKRVNTERARASLARYFSPNVVDAMTANRDQLDHMRVADVAIMFVDIKGFTSLCERMTPDETGNLLRAYYLRLTKVIFAHDGTLDKFMGDGAMVTFGSPVSRPDAAAEAIACCLAVVDEINHWNEARARDRQPAIQIGIGLHYGSALIGNIGDERRLEYAVVGDAVNVASRVEGLTRTLNSKIAVTEACVDAVQRLAGEHTHLLGSLSRAGQFKVKGREQPLQIYSEAL